MVLLSLCSRFHDRSRGCLFANVTFPRNGLKQRRNSVKYPSIHPRQIRENCTGVLYTGQDYFTTIKYNTATYDTQTDSATAHLLAILCLKRMKRMCVTKVFMFHKVRTFYSSPNIGWAEFKKLQLLLKQEMS